MIAPASHHIFYGQSKSVGGQSYFSDGSVKSAQALPGAEMFNNGILAWEDWQGDPRSKNTTDALKRDRFIPMREEKCGSSGETGVVGFATALRAMMATYSGVTSTGDYKIIGSSAGQGNRTLDQLSKGGSIFPRIRADIYYGHLRSRQGRFSDGSLRRYELGSIVFDHGEDDDARGTPRQQYVDGVKQLKCDIEAEAASVTGFSRTIPMFIPQLASHATNAVGGAPNIALAQYDMGMTEQNGIYLACPSYIFDYSDHLHFTAEGSYQRGLYCGLAAWKVLVNKQTNWRPLHPIDYHVDDTFLSVRFGGAVGPLRFSNPAGPPADGYGFRLNHPNGTINEFRKADAIGDRVEFRFDGGIQLGSTLYAGFDGSGVGPNGPRTNLRDSQGDQIVIDGVPLHNWCPIHTLKIT